MIYVDAPTWTKPGTKNPRKRYAHMIADSLEELHAFAASQGIKRHFFHSSDKKPHYDINEEQWVKVTACAAQLVNSRTLIKILKQ